MIRAATSPAPDGVALAHSRRLLDLLRQQIKAHGPMPFSEYMRHCLYAPGLGYYAAGAAKFGGGGDFTTAPESGALFARALAQTLTPMCQQFDDMVVMELGAGSGRLAVDLLLALRQRGLMPSYWILDVSAELRQRQRQAVAQAGLLQQVRWLDQPPSQPWRGALLANEVIDALPVERFELVSGQPQRLAVQCRPDGGFAWCHVPWPEQMAAELGQRLPQELPEGYRSEFLPQLGAWLAGITATLRQGLALFVDYGYPRSEYYHAERSDGTLMCHYRHQSDADPFQWPGLKDLGASVDFSALAEAASQCGLDLLSYNTQARYLLASDLRELMAQFAGLSEPQRMDLATELKRLMLPQAMGERFQLMALGRGPLPAMPALMVDDLRHRL